MKVLNLVNKLKSDIDYTISNYPDGQKNLTVKDIIYENTGTIVEESSTEFYTIDSTHFYGGIKYGVQIKSRLNNTLIKNS